MPKDTFYNLDREKREKIFNSAVKEFSEELFSYASINKIIKSAGIPRGSFYQYFENKDDLYEYVVKEIRNQKIELLEEMDRKYKSTFLNSIKESMKYLVRWHEIKPEYFNIGLLMYRDDSVTVKRLRTMSSYGINRFRNMILDDQKKGYIKEAIEPEIIIEILLNTGTSILKKRSEEGSLNYQDFISEMDKVIDIIQFGIKGEKCDK